jgi:hypothetical protein
MSTPSRKAAILDALRDHPGQTGAGVLELLRERGVADVRNEPAATLSRLVKAGELRSEGSWPTRRYYLPHTDATGAPVPPPAPRPLPVDPHCSRAVIPHKPTPPHPSTLGREPLLDAVVLDHLRADGTFLRVKDIAEAIDEPHKDVALSIRRLLDRSHVVRCSFAADSGSGQMHTYAHRDSTHAVEFLASQAPAGVTPPTTLESGPLHAADGPITEPEPPVVLPPPPAYEPSEVAFRSDLDAHVAARAPELLDWAHTVRSDIEDLVGRACDSGVSHAALKAITTAAFALSRAIEQLHPAGSPPASTGVPQS